MAQAGGSGRRRGPAVARALGGAALAVLLALGLRAALVPEGSTASPAGDVLATAPG